MKHSHAIDPAISASGYPAMPRSRFALSLLAAGLLLTAGVQAQTYSKTETITYSDNLPKWVLGQVESVTCVVSIPASTACNGDVVSQTTFSATDALPTAAYAFGKLQSTMTYNSDGTLATVKDGLNHTTAFSDWKRGIPRLITYPGTPAATRSAVVNDIGWIASVTDETGATMSYGYDAMGRINRITYPVGDTTVWTDTTITFVPVGSAEYGIAANHWRQTVSTGNGRKVTYYDALWRPVLMREYDTADVAGTSRFTATAYDAMGRVTFASYPSTSSSPTTGVWTEYDPLGRVTSVTQDSEPSPLVTTTAYLSGFQTRVTDPRGNATTTQFMAYDQPSFDQPTQIDAPEDTRTVIDRDPFGKPTAITRGATP
jgi:YD repeat-containing protein